MSKLLTHPSCGKQYPGNNRHGHCSGKGLATFNTSMLFPSLDATSLQESPRGGRVTAKDFSDPGGAVAEFIESNNLISIQPSELVRGLIPTTMSGMMGAVLFGGHHKKVVRAVVGSVPVDVVDFLTFKCPRDNSVFVGFNVLGISNPSQSDVPRGGQVLAGGAGGWLFTRLQATDFPAVVGREPYGTAVITASALGCRTLNECSAVNTVDSLDKVHSLTLAYECHETFVGITAFDGHRRTADDGVTRICVIQPYETVQESGKISYGHWLDSDGYYHYGQQMTDERKKELWG